MVLGHKLACSLDSWRSADDEMSWPISLIRSYKPVQKSLKCLAAPLSSRPAHFRQAVPNQNHRPRDPGSPERGNQEPMIIGTLQPLDAAYVTWVLRFTGQRQSLNARDTPHTSEVLPPFMMASNKRVGEPLVDNAKRIALDAAAMEIPGYTYSAESGWHVNNAEPDWMYNAANNMFYQQSTQCYSQYNDSGELVVVGSADTDLDFEGLLSDGATQPSTIQEPEPEPEPEPEVPQRRDSLTVSAGLMFMQVYLGC